MKVHVPDSIRRIKLATDKLRAGTGVPQPLAEAEPIAGASVGAGTGAAAGAVFGAFAGPPGILAGAIIGAAAGAATGFALAEAHMQEDATTARLDREIGVTEGNIGAAPADAPPPMIGAYSKASSGAGAGSVGIPDQAPDEGPMSHGD